MKKKSIMLLTLISTYMQNIISILLVRNLSLAANVCKYTVRYAVRLPFGRFWLMVIVMAGVMVKVSVMVRVSVRSIVRVS